MSTGNTHRSRGRPRLPDGQKQPATVQALDRGLRVLALVAQSTPCTLTALAATADMAPSTVHRMLETLRLHGLVGFEEADQTWSIGVEAFRIGSAFARHARYLEAGRLVMRRLTEETGETANIAIINGGDVVYVSQIETHEPIRAFFPPGTRSCMRASGIGKALLAQLPRSAARAVIRDKAITAFTPHTIIDDDQLFAELGRIRERGWAVDDEECHPGMRCLAASIFNECGEAIAGLSISGPVVRLPGSMLATLGSRVRAGADEITAMIGDNPPDSIDKAVTTRSDGQ